MWVAAALKVEKEKEHEVFTAAAVHAHELLPKLREEVAMSAAASGAQDSAADTTWVTTCNMNRLFPNEPRDKTTFNLWRIVDQATELLLEGKAKTPDVDDGKLCNASTPDVRNITRLYIQKRFLSEFRLMFAGRVHASTVTR